MYVYILYYVRCNVVHKMDMEHEIPLSLVTAVAMPEGKFIPKSDKIKTEFNVKFPQHIEKSQFNTAIHFTVFVLNWMFYESHYCTHSSQLTLNKHK